MSLTKISLKIISVSFLVIVTSLFLFHFCQTANFARSLEWKTETGIKLLLQDLKEHKNKDFTDRSKISLGVYNILYPTLRYYIERQDPVWLELHPVPPYSGSDFYLLEEARVATQVVLPHMTLIRKYVLSGEVLLKPKQEQP
jgi:hypothetical protein